jgi:hypothetical protein
VAPRGLLDATLSLTEIDAWWDQHPDLNIGVDTAKLLVLDVDLPDGAESLAKLEAKHGPLPVTWMQFTGGGGTQYWFAPAEGVRGSVGKIGRNLDIRAAGGYAVAPLSITWMGYRWSVDHHPTTIPLGAASDWLIALALEANAERKGPVPPEEWRALVEGPCLEGQRNDTVTRLVGHLLGHGVDPYVALSFAESWDRDRCVPPLGSVEILAIVNSLCRRETRKRGG